MLIRSERVHVVPGEKAQRISLIESSYLECHSSTEWKSRELPQNAVLAPSYWLSGSVVLLLQVPLKPIVGKSFLIANKMCLLRKPGLYRYMAEVIHC